MNQAKCISIGLLLLRLFAGIRIIYGVQDNVFSSAHMNEFAGFLAQYGFPFPPVSAYLSVYAQLIGGILIIIGWKTKWATLLLTINFMLAVVFVHFVNGDSFEATTPALALLTISLALFFAGPGKFALEREEGSSEKA